MATEIKNWNKIEETFHLRERNATPRHALSSPHHIGCVLIILMEIFMAKRPKIYTFVHSLNYLSVLTHTHAYAYAHIYVIFTKMPIKILMNSNSNVQYEHWAHTPRS